MLLALGLFTLPASAADELVPFGATWKYLDNGSNQGTVWANPGFNDLTWAAGPAQLGYGDGDEATVVASGPVDNHYITTYYRHTFSVTAPLPAYTGLTLQLLKDDGARVYLNGSEIVRSNLPPGTVGYLTTASTTISTSEESVVESYFLSPSLVQVGANVLAVEIHQRSETSSDTSFDLRLVASTPADPIVLNRAPYLQRTAPTEATICWRTNVESDGQVQYGLDPLNLNSSVPSATVGYLHTVRLTGLTPDTRYYYAVGTSTASLAGGDANHYVDTAPLPGSNGPVRIWAIGDSGTADSSAAAVRNAYTNLPGSTATDVWLLLGDNAYDIGTDTEYQAAVFDMYPSILRNVPMWPTVGNHEGISSSSATQSGPYFDIFEPPTAAESGGLASGTESYYSFDHGNVHFVCLDSQGSNPGPAGAMSLWLDADLAATTQDWIIAFWHHPPYTKGSHDSDDSSDSGGRMQQMRTHILPLLEDAGVDLVLCGHSHSYERSYLLDGHYGTSGTLTPAMLIDSGNGRANGDGAYVKPDGGAAHAGAVYIVAGSSGKTSSGPLNHPAMFVSLEELGSVVIDVNALQMDVRFLRETGAIDDYFRIEKEPQQPYIRGDASADGTVNVADSVKALGYLFSQDAISCLRALDANGDLNVDISDPVTILSYLFAGGLALPAPFPSCGVTLNSTLDCTGFSPCP